LGSAVAAACAAPALVSTASAAARHGAQRDRVRPEDDRRNYSKSWQPQTTQVEKKS
jgi:hypothetical protein